MAHIANKFKTLHKNCDDFDSLSDLYSKIIAGYFGKVIKSEMLNREIIISAKDSKTGKETIFHWQGLVDWDRVIDDCLKAMNSTKH